MFEAAADGACVKAMMFSCSGMHWGIMALRQDILYQTSLTDFGASEICEPPKPMKIGFHVELSDNDNMDIKQVLSLSSINICQHLSCISRPLQRSSTFWLTGM